MMVLGQPAGLSKGVRLYAGTNWLSSSAKDGEKTLTCNNNNKNITYDMLSITRTQRGAGRHLSPDKRLKDGRHLKMGVHRNFILLVVIVSKLCPLLGHFLRNALIDGLRPPPHRRFRLFCGFRGLCGFVGFCCGLRTVDVEKKGSSAFSVRIRTSSDLTAQEELTQQTDRKLM